MVDFNEDESIVISGPIQDIANEKLMEAYKDNGAIIIDTAFGRISIVENINIDMMAHVYVIHLHKNN